MSNFIWPLVRDATSFAYFSKRSVEARFGPQICTFHTVSAAETWAASAAMQAATITEDFDMALPTALKTSCGGYRSATRDTATWRTFAVRRGLRMQRRFTPVKSCASI